MLLSDYLLPGSIIMLKLLLKTTTDQESTRVDTVKALIVFPVDIAFLSLSYGSAILYTLQNDAATNLPVKAILTTAFIAIVLLIPVILISKRSERAFVLSKSKMALGLAASSYALALTITAVSVSLGSLFK